MAKATKKCEFCRKTFCRNSRLASHMLKKHGAVWVKKKKLVPTPDNPRPHQCDFCENSYAKRKDMLRHRSSKHIGSKCPECSERYVKLKEHMLLAHNKPLQLQFQCYLCNQQYKSSQCLQSHLRAIHCVADQTFSCPLCAEILKGRVEYQRHRKRHKYERAKLSKRICAICGKAVLVSHFSKHEITHREGTLKCSYCEKRFRTKASVRLHERTHTQERPYECEVGHLRSRAFSLISLFFFSIFRRCATADSLMGQHCGFIA